MSHSKVIFGSISKLWHCFNEKLTPNSLGSIIAEMLSWLCSISYCHLRVLIYSTNILHPTYISGAYLLLRRNGHAGQSLGYQMFGFAVPNLFVECSCRQAARFPFVIREI